MEFNINDINAKVNNLNIQADNISGFKTTVNTYKSSLNTYWSSLESGCVDRKLSSLCTKLGLIKSAINGVAGDISIAANEVMEERRAAEEAARIASEKEKEGEGYED